MKLFIKLCKYEIKRRKDYFRPPSFGESIDLIRGGVIIFLEGLFSLLIWLLTPLLWLGWTLWVGLIEPAIMHRKYSKDVIEKWVNDERFK